jgi:hypothetical protein
MSVTEFPEPEIGVFNVCLQPAFTLNDNCTAIEPAVQCPLKTQRVLDAAGQLADIAKSNVTAQQEVCCAALDVSIPCKLFCAKPPHCDALVPVV